jgi:hypothetical protein
MIRRLITNSYFFPSQHPNAKDNNTKFPMSKIIHSLYILFALTVSTPSSWAQGPTTNNPNQGGVLRRLCDSIETYFFNLQLTLNGSELTTSENVGTNDWTADIRYYCDSAGGNLVVTAPPGENTLYFFADGLIPNRFAATVGGPPGTPTPFGGPGSMLCAVPFQLFHFTPQKTSPTGVFVENHLLGFPGGSEWSFVFQVWCRDPTNSWNLVLTNGIRVDITVSESPPSP